MNIRASLLTLMTAAVMASSTVAEERPRPVPGPTPRGGTWQSIGQLPDWSGVWSITPQSAALSNEDDGSCDHGRVPLTPRYEALRAAGSDLPSCPKAADVAPVQPLKLHNCLPPGVPGVMSHTYGFEFLFSPGRVTMIFEDGEVRRIYTDGRSHKKSEDLYESLSGDSIGHWDKNVLVVDTVGMRPEAEVFDGKSIQVTRNTRVLERISLENKDTLQITSTLLDPEIFTKPYTYRREYQRSPLGLIESVCLLNDRDSDQDIDLTPPAPNP